MSSVSKALPTLFVVIDPAGLVSCSSPSRAIVLIFAYVFLRASARLARLLEQTGMNVATRVLGLLLAALAVQYVADGVAELNLSLGA